jgi:hypothetical protein
LNQRSPIRRCPPNRAIVLANRTCVYCGRELTDRGFTKEHVIGRQFVPKGLLNGEWNLIIHACDACNHAKSDLEDDISAITLQRDAWGQHPIEDPRRDAEARRKARSKSRRTQTSVGQSTEHFDVTFPFGRGVEMRFGVASPPQLDVNRVYRLCMMHSQAFFYWITYDETSKRGRLWPTGGFFGTRVRVSLTQRSQTALGPYGDARLLSLFSSSSFLKVKSANLEPSSYR